MAPVENSKNPLYLPQGSIRALAFLFTTFCCLVGLPLLSTLITVDPTLVSIAMQTWGIMVGYYFGKRDADASPDNGNNHTTSPPPQA